MKKVYILLLFVISGVSFAETNFVSGFLNDNYTGSTANGLNGDYIGADDFLTFSLFAKSKRDNFTISEYYHVITSRKYGYRYDLLNTIIEYDLTYSDYFFTPSVTIMHKTNLGGEFVQNSIHDFRDLPELHEEYVSDELGISIGLSTYYDILDVILKNDSLKGVLDLEFPSAIKPVTATLSLGYLLDFDFLKFDIVGGYKQYITEVDQYSDFLRSGLIFGGQGIITIFNKLSINAGAFFFPTRNLKNDPYYFNKSFDYSPQLWVTFGFNGGYFRVLDVVDF